jgi:hypothetical protein
VTDSVAAPPNDNFEAWREAVGFEEGFPRLRVLAEPAPPYDAIGFEQQQPSADSRRFFLNAIHRESVAEIYQSMGSSARIVLTAPGHGATTLARLMYQIADRQALIRRAIPVLLSIEDLILPASYDSLVQRAMDFAVQNHPGLAQRVFEPWSKPVLTDSASPEERAKAVKEQLEDYLADLQDAADALGKTYFGKITANYCVGRIEEAIRTAVVRSLASQRWDRVINRGLYRDILNCKDPNSGAFEAKRQELSQFIADRKISDAQWSQIRDKAPMLGDPDYQELIRQLQRGGNVRISLILDLSATPIGRVYLGEEAGEYNTTAYENLLLNFSKAVKNIEQKANAGPQPVLPSLLDKTYFLGRSAWNTFKADFAAQEEDIINFPPYRPVDVFAMLAQHYPPHHDENGRRSEVLAAVLDSSFIEINPSIALSTELAIVESQLRDEIEHERDLRYHRRATRRVSDEVKAEMEKKFKQMQDEMQLELEKFRKQIGYSDESD